LGGRKGIRPVKNEWWGVGVAVCLERGAGLHMAQLMPVPLTVSCSSKIQIGFTFLVPAYPGCPGKEAVKWLCGYVDLNFGMTSTGIQCMYNHNYKCLDQAYLSKPQPDSAALPVMGLWTASTTSSSYYKIYMF